MKIKYLDGEGWDWLDDYACEIRSVNGHISGVVSYVSQTRVKYPLTVDYEVSSRVLFDNGYKCVTFLPDLGNWCVNAVYDLDSNIVEWYFDILKTKGVDANGRHYYHDLYLDVVVRPDFETVILDEDELKEALEAGIITEEDYHLAYETSKFIINVIVKDRPFMIEFLKEQLLVS